MRALGRLPETSAERARGGPPQVARSLAAIYTAAYDAWSVYDSTAKPVHAATTRRPASQRRAANRRQAVSQAAYRALVDQFPPDSFVPPCRAQYEAGISALMAAEGITPGDADTSADHAVGVRKLAANAVVAARHGDGANQVGLYASTSPYAPVNPPMLVLQPAAADAIADVGRWQSWACIGATGQLRTPGYIAPHWSTVAPFAMTADGQFRPGPPQATLGQGFLDQARHVVQVQAELTPAHKVTAEYWADGPNSELPPGHWTTFAAFVVERDGLDLDASVKLYFALANAIMDASIAVWDCKRHCDYARPVTAIRRFTGSDAFGHQHTQAAPLVADPYEAATGTVLHWPTFTAAALEAGESRLYGGIHFYEGNVVGLDIGRRCGDAACARAQDLWSGA